MLVKKQSVKSNSQWLEAYKRSTELYSYEDIQTLEAKTIARIELVARAYNNVCSGWIAGKDSLALSFLLSKTSIRHTPIMWRGINEYPAMAAWIEKNKPHNLVEEVIDKYTLDFLEKNPEYLFCKGKTRLKWMNTKWERQRKDINKHGFDLFITGRRLKDGNLCGNAENNFIVPKKGFDTFSPLGDWNNEQLLAYVKYNHIQLPPFYSYDRGFLIGSIAMGEWTERAVLDKTEEEVWQELYDIDKSIVINASAKLSSAREFLKGRQNT